MESSLRPSVVSSVPDVCLRACGVLQDRDGCTIVSHYRSVAGEIAACMKSVGLSDRSDYGVLELRGDRELLDRALIDRLGDPPLPVGSGRRLRSVWYLRVHARRTLLVGPTPRSRLGHRSDADVTAATYRTATSAHRWRSSASSAPARRDCSPPPACQAACRLARLAPMPATQTSSRSCARASDATSRSCAPRPRTTSGLACSPPANRSAQPSLDTTR